MAQSTDTKSKALRFVLLIVIVRSRRPSSCAWCSNSPPSHFSWWLGTGSGPRSLGFRALRR